MYRYVEHNVIRIIKYIQFLFIQLKYVLCNVHDLGATCITNKTDNMNQFELFESYRDVG